jgi:hypothetical protein
MIMNEAAMELPNTETPSTETPNTVSLEAALKSKRQELLTLYGDPPVVQAARLKQYQQLEDETLALERQIAKANGEEYAAEWHLLDYEALMSDRVRVIGQDARCFLVLENHVMVYFNRAIAYKLEGINDEAIEGHRLAGRGLTYWETFVIENSRWLAQVKAAHLTHPGYNEQHWDAVRHYLIFFKERVFEVLSGEAPVLMPHASFNEAIESALLVLDGKVTVP